ncbi:hypothetical protein [Nocardia sp. NPDC059691]|uniref:hypothetical protein n=1 Tax=Nocardia sp. NPDC059691 TaxID=3346908 RepID=UPI003677CE4E
MTDPSTRPSTSPDRFAQYGLVPPDLQEAPIDYDFSADAARDDLHTKHLRGLQNLAAEASREQRPAEQAPTQHAWLASTPRSAALQTALRAATRDATADGVPGEKIARAVDLGRTGVYWHQQPSDRTLGRFEKLNAAVAAAEMDAAALRALVERVPRFVAEEWNRTVARDLRKVHSANASGEQPSRSTTIAAVRAAGHGSGSEPGAIGSAITDAMPDTGAATTWTNDASPADRGADRGVGSQAAEL